MASSSQSFASNIHSGPIDNDVLWMQQKHISQHIWNDSADRKLSVRRTLPKLDGEEPIPAQITQFLVEAGFYHIAQIGFLRINGGLINAFVERWRLETYTFHMKCGECTITLQDVAILLGFPVNGLPLMAPTDVDWTALCEELLGVRPDEDDIKGSTVKLKWLAHHFGDVNQHEGNEEQLRRYTRAWILRFIGGFLFVDKTSSKVSLRYLQFLRDFHECSTYAWGAAVLGFLYRELCVVTDYEIKSIGGMCVLIQLWAWERFLNIAPTRTPPIPQNKPVGARWLRRGNKQIGSDDLKLHRSLLDTMKQSEVVWEPYTPSVMQHLPIICIEGQAVWKCVVPLICFNICEWHQPDRVMRQFGLQQPIPRHPVQLPELHGLTMRGKQSENWHEMLQPAILAWFNRLEHAIEDTRPQVGDLGFNSDYMVWYRRKTKMFIDPSNAKAALLGEVVETLAFMVSLEGRNTWSMDDLVPYVEKLMVISNHEDHLTRPAVSAPPSIAEVEAPQFNLSASYRETRGLDRRKANVQPQAYDVPHFPDRGHGLYYTPPHFLSQDANRQPTYYYPSQHDPHVGSSQQVPFEPRDTFQQDMMERLFGSLPTTPMPQQQGTPITPAAPQFDIPWDPYVEAMQNIEAIDLRGQFSAEADKALNLNISLQGAPQLRVNPPRNARNWTRPCVVSPPEEHHHHH